MAWSEASIQHHSSTTVGTSQTECSIYPLIHSLLLEGRPTSTAVFGSTWNFSTNILTASTCPFWQATCNGCNWSCEGGWVGRGGGGSDFHLCLTGSYMPFNKLHVWEIVGSKPTVWHFTAGSTSGREARYWRMSVCPSEAAMCTGCSSPCMRY